MPNSTAVAVRWVEQGLVPDRVVRLGVRRLLRARLAELRDDDVEARAALTQQFVERMQAADLAPVPHKANQQHYELPAAFFERVLGPHRKYSACHWAEATGNEDDEAAASSEASGLGAAEADALRITAERASLADGQTVLELGCGWGSLSLWMAERFPRSRIVALSNSHSQRLFIEARARERGFGNLRVMTCDINDFDTDERFDRIVSVEMFEHLRNWSRAFGRIASWLGPGGRFFMHVFVHRGAPYAFEERDASDWMSRHFFSGGMMPSDDLALFCQDDLRLLRRWHWSGLHYRRTAEAWLRNLDASREALEPLMRQTYGAEHAVWWTRWRLFFIAVSELFGYDGGRRWCLGHYLFESRSRR